MTDERGGSGRILDRIHSRNFQGRKALVEELRRERSERAVASLIELLADESWTLRELAVEALAESPELAAPRLHALLRAGLWYTRAAAARGLGLIAHAPALPDLLSMIGDSNQTIAQEVATALLQMARRGLSVAVARGILARGDRAEEGFVALERMNPDAGRKLRVLAARAEVAAPVKEWLLASPPDPEVLERQLLREPDDAFGVRWDEISGPVGGA
jgi:hypothetical protein